MHPKIYQELAEEESKVTKGNTSKRPCQESLAVAGSAMKQAKLAFGKGSITIPMDVKTLKNACLELVTKNGRPFSLFCDSGFQMLVAPMMQALKCHVDEKTIRDIVSERAAQVRSFLGDALKSTLLCIKMDIATRLDRSFLGINVQYVSNGQLRLKTLGVSEISGPHTAQSVRALLQGTLMKFNLSLDDVLSLTTDNGSNMIACTKIINEERERELHEDESESEDDGEIENDDSSEITMDAIERDPCFCLLSMRCAAHTLQLVVRDALKGHTVSETILAARSVVKKLRRPTLRALLKQRYGRRPVIDVETRWMSTHDMLTCLLSMRSLTEELGPAMPEVSLNNEQWRVIEGIVAATQPFKDMTLKLQAKNLLAGDFLAGWERLKITLRKLSNTEQDCLAALLLERVLAREPLLLTNDIILAAVFCDPRYRLLLNGCDTQRAQGYLERVATRIAKKHSTRSPDDQEEHRSSGDELRLELEDSEDELESSLRASEREERSAIAQGIPDAGFAKFLEWYQKTSRLSKDQDILKWWESQENSPMQKAALTVLALPVTQVSVERLFSGLAFVLNPLRNRLGSTTIEDIMLLRTNGVEGDV